MEISGSCAQFVRKNQLDPAVNGTEDGTPNRKHHPMFQLYITPLDLMQTTHTCLRQQALHSGHNGCGWRVL